MKKSYIILLFILLTFSAFGQKIRFSDSTNVWTILTTYPTGPGVGKGTYILNNNYSGSISVNGKKYLILDSYYIREDTIANKIFVWCCDTTEMLLYDYSWHVGDTVLYPQGGVSANTAKAWVTSIDSTQINGIWYKVWHFSATIYPISGIFYYNVIEGIGCTNLFDFPLAVPEPMDEGANQLLCFYNNGLTAPLSSPVISYGPGDYFNLNFQNTNGCPPLDVSGISPKKVSAVSIFPNPIDETTRIVFPNAISSGTVIILNEIGTVILNLPFQNKEEMLIGDIIKTPGIYCYRVLDNDNGKVFSGKFAAQ